ncbi:hypothetical protein Tco_1451459 [Tanacetum coccineum]
MRSVFQPKQVVVGKQVEKDENIKRGSPEKCKGNNKGQGNEVKLIEDMKEGNVDMRNYFKQRWKLLVDKGKVHDDNEEDDVISATNGIENV